MRHRHLDVGNDSYTVAAIHSILERGGASDVLLLLSVLQSDPFSTVAEAALEAARTSEVFGYPDMIVRWIIRCRELARIMHQRPEVPALAL
jgi:hypothetical protein